MTDEPIIQLARAAATATSVGDYTLFKTAKTTLQGDDLRLFWAIYELHLPKPAPWSQADRLAFAERRECSGFGAVK